MITLTLVQNSPLLGLHPRSCYRSRCPVISLISIRYSLSVCFPYIATRSRSCYRSLHAFFATRVFFFRHFSSLFPPFTAIDHGSSSFALSLLSFPCSVRRLCKICHSHPLSDPRFNSPTRMSLLYPNDGRAQRKIVRFGDFTETRTLEAKNIWEERSS